jgi:hypothetical protein
MNSNPVVSESTRLFEIERLDPTYCCQCTDGSCSSGPSSAWPTTATTVSSAGSFLGPTPGSFHAHSHPHLNSLALFIATSLFSFVCVLLSSFRVGVISVVEPHVLPVHIQRATGQRDVLFGAYSVHVYACPWICLSRDSPSHVPIPSAGRQLRVGYHMCC